MEEQLQATKILTKQIEAADLEKKNVVVLGDVNICSNKWNDADFKYQSIADEIRSTLAQCGMEHSDVGTYIHNLYFAILKTHNLLLVFNLLLLLKT